MFEFLLSAFFLLQFLLHLYLSIVHEMFFLKETVIQWRQRIWYVVFPFYNHASYLFNKYLLSIYHVPNAG